MPESSAGGLSENLATSDKLPPMASTVRSNVESGKSIRCSIRDTASWLTLNS